MSTCKSLIGHAGKRPETFSLMHSWFNNLDNDLIQQRSGTVECGDPKDHGNAPTTMLLQTGKCLWREGVLIYLVLRIETPEVRVEAPLLGSDISACMT